jgi:hypothetical protein
MAIVGFVNLVEHKWLGRRNWNHVVKGHGIPYSTIVWSTWSIEMNFKFVHRRKNLLITWTWTISISLMMISWTLIPLMKYNSSIWFHLQEPPHRLIVYLTSTQQCSSYQFTPTNIIENSIQQALYSLTQINIDTYQKEVSSTLGSGTICKWFTSSAGIFWWF